MSDQYLIVRVHLFKSSLHPIVQITNDEVVIVEDVGVELLTFSSDAAKNLLHHFISGHTVVCSMHKMATNEVETAVPVLKEDLHTTLVLSKAKIFTDSTSLVIGSNCIDVVRFLLFDVADERHLPLRSVSHPFQALGCQMRIEPFDKSLHFLAFLKADHKQIIFFWVGNQLVEAGTLRFTSCIPSDIENFYLFRLLRQLSLNRLQHKMEKCV